MRRLLSLIKKIAPYSAEQQEVMEGRLKRLILFPGECVGRSIPSGSWIFIEEGFLVLLRHQNGRWTCSNFYYEGVRTTVYYDEDMTRLDGCLEVKAVEMSTIYYLTKEDEKAVVEVFPGFQYASLALGTRSHAQHRRRARLFEIENDLNRIMAVQRFFPFLFRAPAEDLADFLGLEDERHRRIIEKSIEIYNSE